VSAPLTLFAQYVITYVLSAPTESGDHSVDVVRTRSVVAKETSGKLREVCGDSLSADFKNLLDELSSFCQQLRVTNQQQQAAGELIIPND
jgi:hypothetical protein